MNGVASLAQLSTESIWKQWLDAGLAEELLAAMKAHPSGAAALERHTRERALANDVPVLRVLIRDDDLENVDAVPLERIVRMQDVPEPMRLLIEAHRDFLHEEHVPDAFPPGLRGELPKIQDNPVLVKSYELSSGPFGVTHERDRVFTEVGGLELGTLGDGAERSNWAEEMYHLMSPDKRERMQRLLGIPHDPPELRTRQARESADVGVRRAMQQAFSQAVFGPDHVSLEDIVAPSGPDWSTAGYGSESTRAPKPPCLTAWQTEQMVRDGQRLVVQASITMEFGERSVWPASWGPR